MIDIINISVPLTRDTKNVDICNIKETCQQHFSTISTFQPAFHEYECLCAQGFLISGDVNVHSWEYNCTTNEDDIGGNIINIWMKLVLFLQMIHFPLLPIILIMK